MKTRTLLTATVACAALMIPAANAATILGTGTASLLGGDLTDPEDDGDGAGNNYNATFFASKEPGFGGGEFSFNVFNNQVGGGNAKMCCEGAPIVIGAIFTDQYLLTHFTMTSSNDSPLRDPNTWSIQGSNDTTTGLDGTWSDIFVDNTVGTLWTARNQVIRYDGAGSDFATPSAHSSFRLNFLTSGGPQTALAEIEFFGTPIPESSTFALAALAGLGLVLRRRR